MDFAQIEQKWQKRWADGKIFEPDPQEGKKKFYLTAAFPYPNSPQHIGHARTYTTTDVYARYMRMRGCNVLFPMGFHVTGTPVLAMSKRVAAKDPELYEIFEKIYNVPADVIPTLDEPAKLVTYFSNEIELGMKEIGFSIDWRRKFYTYDAEFNNFIKWQFEKLYNKGYLVKGSHPVPWCPNDNNAVGAHDTKGDLDPNIDQMVMIKFELKDSPGEFLLCATFRPETIYGVTNVWVNPSIKYSLVDVDGKKYWVSSEVAKSLPLQLPQMKVISEKDGSEFEGKTALNPINGVAIPIFPASFVAPEVGSGVVMSVPAHAPYDYLALRDLKGTKWEPMIPEPIQVLTLDGYGPAPAKEIVERMGVKDQNDRKAEAATEELYSKEAHTGKMAVGDYKGMAGMQAKEKIREGMVAEGKALMLHDVINGPIHCRCGARVCVKLVQDQWFIDYGNAEWKDEVRKAFTKIALIPEKARPEYDYTIGWLKQRACVRAQGLGTKFPFDETKIIESLSDSTIYMAFYTISHYIKGLPPEKLDTKFFDFVFLGKGDATAVAEHVGVSEDDLRAVRAEFLYWYPLDSRHSAGDLIHNHLTFFVFNHACIFPESLWPRQIVTNGFVLMEGGKMSKSMGNIMPLRQAIRKHGADIVRFSVVSGAELSADSDFNQAMVDGVTARLRWMASLIEENTAGKSEGEPKKAIDDWLLSRMHRRLKKVANDFNSLILREITLEIFYNSINDLRWYFKRTRGNRETLREFFRNWILVMAPFTPHTCEELWEMTGGKGFVSLAAWPEPDEGKIKDSAEFAEEIIVKTRDDIENILKLTGKKPATIYLFAASPWKRRLYLVARQEKRFDSAMKKAMEDEELKANAKAVGKFLQSLVKDVGGLKPAVISQEDEVNALKGAAGFLGSEFGCSVEVFTEEEAAKEEHKKKSANAVPLKPSIFIE